MCYIDWEAFNDGKLVIVVDQTQYNEFDNESAHNGIRSDGFICEREYKIYHNLSYDKICYGHKLLEAMAIYTGDSGICEVIINRNKDYEVTSITTGDLNVPVVYYKAKNLKEFTKNSIIACIKNLYSQLNGVSERILKLRKVMEEYDT